MLAPRTDRYYAAAELPTPLLIVLFFLLILISILPAQKKKSHTPSPIPTASAPTFASVPTPAAAPSPPRAPRLRFSSHLRTTLTDVQQQLRLYIYDIETQLSTRDGVNARLAAAERRRTELERELAAANAKHTAALGTLTVALAEKESAHTAEAGKAVAAAVEHAVERKRLVRLLATKDAKCAALERLLADSRPAAGRLRRANARLEGRVDGLKRDLEENSFAVFRERLLLKNRVWRQEREIARLRAQVDARGQIICENAFAAFCQRLLLSNKVWHQERDLHALVAGRTQPAADSAVVDVASLQSQVERLRQARISGIASMAKRMVADSRKDILIEELVKDLVQDVENAKKEAETLRAAHREEVDKINSGWIEDNRKLAREVEALKLAQQARFSEQEVANAMEQSLMESLQRVKRKADHLEDKVAEYETIIYGESKPPRSPTKHPRPNTSHLRRSLQSGASSPSDSRRSSTAVEDGYCSDTDGESTTVETPDSTSLLPPSSKDNQEGAGEETKPKNTSLLLDELTAFPFPPAFPPTRERLPSIFKFKPVMLFQSDSPTALSTRQARLSSSDRTLAGHGGTTFVPLRLPSVQSDGDSRSPKRAKTDGARS